MKELKELKELIERLEGLMAAKSVILNPGDDPSKIEDFTYFVDCQGPATVKYCDPEFGDRPLFSKDTAAYVATDMNFASTMRHYLPTLIEKFKAMDEFMRNLVDKAMPIVEGFSDESSPMLYTSVLNDVILCLKQAVDDAMQELERPLPPPEGQ